jgi:hypothetical protein
MIAIDRLLYQTKIFNEHPSRNHSAIFIFFEQGAIQLVLPMQLHRLDQTNYSLREVTVEVLHHYGLSAISGAHQMTENFFSYTGFES